MMKELLEMVEMLEEMLTSLLHWVWNDATTTQLIILLLGIGLFAKYIAWADALADKATKKFSKWLTRLELRRAKKVDDKIASAEEIKFNNANSANCFRSFEHRQLK